MTGPTGGGAAPRPGPTGRAAARAAFVTGRAGEFDAAELAEAMARRVTAEAEAAADTAPVPQPKGRKRAAKKAVPAKAVPVAKAAAAAVAKGLAAGDVRRWVPIGPSVVRSQPGREYPRSTGRIRDLQVSSNGRRAYAASAKGGVWYTEDAGASWSPVGGWAERPAVRGGANNVQACGCLLVKFEATAVDDFVLVGTGELQGFGRPPIRPAFGGIGVLAAKGPAVSPLADSVVDRGDPWEREAGIGMLEGLGCYRLARHPAATAGDATAGPTLDRVALGTSAGLFLGTRRHIAVAPAHDEFGWAPCPALGAFMGLVAGAQPIVTDVLWLPRGANGRIVVSVARGIETATAGAPVGSGVAFSDDLGASFTWVVGLNPAVGAEPGTGRMSFAHPAATRVYVLGDRRVVGVDTPTIWRIADVSAAAPAATLLTGVPPLWTVSSTGRSQRDYDQAIAVDVVGGADRVYLAGNYVVLLSGDLASSVWCFDVTGAGALVPATGISRGGIPPGGEGADPPGLVGNNVHADVHTIRLVGAALPRQVWVSTDGGVFVSTLGGRVNTFAPRSNGLAAMEVNFVVPHPTTSQFAAAGTQDNGRHERLGDVVWEETFGGDGGGVAFHPVRPDFIVSQTTRADWWCTPGTNFVDPLGRALLAGGRESDQSAFYSGAAAVRTPAPVGRIAIGTTRAWLTDDVASPLPNTWNALPYPTGLMTDPRPGGTDPVANRNVGVPAGGGLGVATNGLGPLGAVTTMKWASPTVLLVLFEKGLVRWTQDSVTLIWTARVLVGPSGVALVPPVVDAPNPATNMLTDVAPVPGTDNLYLTTSGDPGNATRDTCFFFNAATSTFLAANLRAQLAPLDPVYSVTVDPGTPTEVYVGTVTGVWRGVRTPGVAAHAWTTQVNGLPQAAVQDLSIWTDPAVPGSPRLLRAAVQSRGVWEVDLAAATEPARTYARVHPADDRRRFPTPMANPRQPPAGSGFRAFNSPDIAVRPRVSNTTTPAWRLLGPATLNSGNVLPYELWTFQTAFRWLYPSVTADGRWTAGFGEVVRAHRNRPGLLPPLDRIDKRLWDKVVGETRLDPVTGAVTANPAHDFAVYRAPWQTPAVMSAVATEVDLMESVVPPQVLVDGWQVYKERSVVDVLIHHRDTRARPLNDAFALLLWRSDPSRPDLLLSPATPLQSYIRAAAGGATPATPVGWNLAAPAVGSVLHTLPVRLDARMPRAVSMDVDLSTVPDNHFVLLVAAVGSSIDQCAALPVGLPATPSVVELARRWPYLALRVVQVIPRP